MITSSATSAEVSRRGAGKAGKHAFAHLESLRETSEKGFAAFSAAAGTSEKGFATLSAAAGTSKKGFAAFSAAAETSKKAIVELPATTEKQKRLLWNFQRRRKSKKGLRGTFSRREMEENKATKGFPLFNLLRKRIFRSAGLRLSVLSGSASPVTGCLFMTFQTNLLFFIFYLQIIFIFAGQFLKFKTI
jgi:hypothetical protein